MVKIIEMPADNSIQDLSKPSRLDPCIEKYCCPRCICVIYKVVAVVSVCFYQLKNCFGFAQAERG